MQNTTKRKQTNEENTNSHPFRVAEKKYKKYKNAETDFSEVIDFYNPEKNTEENKRKFKKLDVSEKSKSLFGKSIEAFEFTDPNLQGTQSLLHSNLFRFIFYQESIFSFRTTLLVRTMSKKIPRKQCE